MMKSLTLPGSIASQAGKWLWPPPGDGSAQLEANVLRALG